MAGEASEKIRQLILQMTIEEKASLCSGQDVWRTQDVARLGIPYIMVSDGPHGLRTQKEKHNFIFEPAETISAVCFPTGSCLACSFDRDLIRRVGEVLGDECRAEGVSVLLGPAVNSKRSPLCGRNFEYYSEDPFLTAQIAVGFIQGVQSRGVGTSVKHFAVNNQESRRMTTSANVDERTLREIYLAGFEGAVKQGKPWTVMCSYNRINGVYSSENRRLLTDILREEWGFDGLVMSDWGAVNDRVKGLEAGLDLEMPGSGNVNNSKIVHAVKEGKISEDTLNQAAERVLKLVYKALETPEGKDSDFDRKAHSRIARETARECMVLLKNENHILPLKRSGKIAFIGEFAEKPRYQGGGSSHVNSSYVTSALEAVKGVSDVTYSRGYDTSREAPDTTLIANAVKAAKASETAVIFAGLPDSYESESWDRKHMHLPACQNELIWAVSKAQPNTVVVLHNGSPVEMPWANSVKGILEAYLGGQETGGAVVDLLFGDANPCGKLAESFPLKLSDNPSYLNFPGDGDECNYREGLFTGYRYYDKKEMPVLFPFGHGLSYTEFSYENMQLGADEITDNDILNVTVTVKNTGKVFGKEILQLYVCDRQTNITRPLKELKGFEKVSLNPGESKTVTFILNKRSFAYYNPEIKDWVVNSGTFDILVGASSRDIRLRAQVRIHSSVQLKPHFTLNSTVSDILKYESGKKAIQTLLDFVNIQIEGETVEEKLSRTESMFGEFPLRTVIEFTRGVISEELVIKLIDMLNH
ncbi:MAG TPA: glycoside hydrolase family 3 C-terminal domain-containing protein [Caproicibacter sp.]|nr:glycoside hydrolase family 3 C-terminal domain-containing protein [Caproicibacter sp.]